MFATKAITKYALNILIIAVIEVIEGNLVNEQWLKVKDYYYYNLCETIF